MEEGRRSRVVNWSDLPPEILFEIGKRLRFRVDVLRFRSVCKSWRNSLPCKTKINKGDNFIKIPKPPIVYGIRYREEEEPVSYVLTERTVYALHPNASQLNCKGRCNSYYAHIDDWSCPKIVEFEEILPCTFMPYLIYLRSSLRPFSKVVNMLDFSVSPLSKHHGLIAVNDKQQLGGGGGHEEKKDSFFDRFQFYAGCFDVVDKVVVLSKYNYVSIMCPINDDVDDDGVLVVGALLPKGKVGLLRLLGSDNTPDPVGWRVINYNYNYNYGKGNRTLRFDDIVDLGGRLCVIDYHGRAYVVDSSSLELTEIAAPPRICNVEGLQLLQRRKRLVHDSGDLFLLIPCLYQVRGALQCQIKIYKLKVQTREWVEVVSLGDLALFVSDDFSFAAPVRNILRKAECYRNCIFFNRFSFRLHSRSYCDESKDPFFKELSCRDVAAFDLPDGANFRLACDESKRWLLFAEYCYEILYSLPCCLLDRPRKQFTMPKSNS